MTWSDIPRNPTPKVLRQFAVAWLVFFLSVAGLLGWARGRVEIGWLLAAVALAGGVGGWLRPGLLRGIFVGWMIVAFPLGWLVSQLVLAILFYGVFTPLALVFRLIGRDALAFKKPSGQATFWRPKPTPSDPRRYFRQY